VRAEVVIASALWGVTATVAVACELGLAVIVAVMVTEVLLVTLGAVKAPLLDTVPALADQVTEVSAVPLMLAANCCWPCDARFALTGKIESRVPEALAETTICTELDPYSFTGTVAAPFAEFSK
jgi:hypothetical protein